MGKENYDVLKAATRRFADKVREMRQWQKTYYTAPKESEEKQRALGMKRKMEAEVDAVVAKINQVIDTL